MSRKFKGDKTLSEIRPTFTVFRNRCPICMLLNHKSKLFTTLYNLQYHLSEHTRDDEISTGISIPEIKNVISQIGQAIQWKMLS